MRSRRGAGPLRGIAQALRSGRGAGTADGAGAPGGAAMSVERRAMGSALLLGAVPATGLLAVADAGGVERPADDLVAHARQVLDAATAHEHDGVLLEVVALARDVGGDLHGPGDEIGRSTRLNSSHANISYAVFCLQKTK